MSSQSNVNSRRLSKNVPIPINEDSSNLENKDEIENGNGNENENENDENEMDNQNNLQSYVRELSKKLESIMVVFASTRIMLDPRVFLYRFPRNKCRVVTNIVGKKRKVYDGTYLLERNVNESNIEQSSSENACWQYISLKHRPWNKYNIPKRSVHTKNTYTEPALKDGEADTNKVVPILNRY